MTTYRCPHCRSALELVVSGRYGICRTCTAELKRGPSSPTAYSPIGHDRPHPFGHTLGQAARDEGTARVLENAGQEWRDQIAAVIDGLARSRPDFTADDVRAEAERAGVPPPHHHNAWGAAMQAAAKRDVIQRTNETRSSERAAANAHRNPVWRSLIYQPEPLTMPLYAPEPEEVW